MQFSTRRTNFYTLLLFISFDTWTVVLYVWLRWELCIRYLLGAFCQSQRYISNSTSYTTNSTFEFLFTPQCGQKKNLAKNNTYILAEQVWSLPNTYLFVISFLLYFTPSDINEWENILCLNNGTCTDRSNRFNCSCPPRFSYNWCEISYLCIAVIFIVRLENLYTNCLC